MTRLQQYRNRTIGLRQIDDNRTTQILQDNDNTLTKEYISLTTMLVTYYHSSSWMHRGRETLTVLSSVNSEWEASGWGLRA